MRVYLIGVGVVGREILQSHLAAAIPICIADQNEIHLRESVDQLGIAEARLQRTRLGRFPAIKIDDHGETESAPTVVIESVSEKLDIKQSLFESCERFFGEDAILCSNTSTLRIEHIAGKLKRPNRVCGMHFFMPVRQRDAVEIVRGELTDAETIDVCAEHVRSLGKIPLVVADGPGFIVNRLLCPYLNAALLLLCQGVSAAQIERAAVAYGMPMSPFELMDWIGIRTVFDAGRVFWQSFPSRFEPSPIPPALIKAQRFGRACGRGCYDYYDGHRSDDLSPATEKICARYQRGELMQLSDEDVMLLLSIPMWIEAAYAFREQVATTHQQFDLAMRGGLGFQASGTWLGFFKSLGSEKICDTLKRFAPMLKSLTAPDELVDQLKLNDPGVAIDAFATT